MATAASPSPLSLLLSSLSSLRLSQSLPPPHLLTLPKPPLNPPTPQTLKHQPPITPLSSKHDLINVVCPGLANANTLFFKSAYNLQVIVGEHEPEEKLIGRFRREVFRAGIIQECKRRRYFETNQEKRKRKTRDAARRNRKRRPMLKAVKQDDTEEPQKVKEEEDNWDFIDVDLPYS
ncbi:hypothetical protein ACET3Z_027395 [Daucus carota]